MRSITTSKKHGKICHNIKTEPKIFHARIDLVSDKFGKTNKITSLLCLLLPILVFKILVLPVFSPKKFTKKLTRLFYRFIWGLDWERISRQNLYNGIKHGAKMVDVEKYFLSLKVKWINNFWMITLLHSGRLSNLL